MMKIYNTEQSHGICAFCRFWYDPTNSAIAPEKGRGFWLYDDQAMKKCTKMNVPKASWCRCSDYQCKV